MKRFNLLIITTVFFYIAVALAAGYYLKAAVSKNSQAYKVEMNRIFSSLSEGTSFDRLDLHSYKYVEKVSFLPAGELSEEDSRIFYQEENKSQIVIKPLFIGASFQGMVRFDYRITDGSSELALIMTEICLSVMELFLLGILFYLKYRLIAPFERLSGIPDKLAKGHLKEVVKEEKNQYFGRFLWGVGQLKDHLEITKKRELELIKEKKKMLLSLSHDIKTPLNTIKLYGKALEDNLYMEEEKKKHAAHQIGVKAGEIQGYLEEIIKSSREDILDIQVKDGEFYLKDLMGKVLDTYAEECSIREAELTVGTYENSLLNGDIERTFEVFENIIENTFKYGDGGKIEITFSEEDYCRLIHIFNTGGNVNETEFNHIFESFFRGTNSEGKQGNGLGLYICREIMRKMGGDIYAENKDEGMEFTLVFR